jgi:hypothetical protein
MESPKYVLEHGTEVITHEVLGTTSGILVKNHHLDARKPSTLGVIRGWVAGHGGDIYWVQHGKDFGEDVAVYCWSEFEFSPTEQLMRDVMES